MKSGLPFRPLCASYRVGPVFPCVAIPRLGRQQIEGVAHELAILSDKSAVASGPSLMIRHQRAASATRIEIAAHSQPESFGAIAGTAIAASRLFRVVERHGVDQHAIERVEFCRVELRRGFRCGRGIENALQAILHGRQPRHFPTCRSARPAAHSHRLMPALRKAGDRQRAAAFRQSLARGGGQQVVMPEDRGSAPSAWNCEI